MNLNESLLLSLLNVSFICCLGNLYIFVMSICTCRQMSVRVCILLSSRGKEGLDGLNEEFTCKLWGEKKKSFFRLSVVSCFYFHELLSLVCYYNLCCMCVYGNIHLLCIYLSFYVGCLLFIYYGCFYFKDYGHLKFLTYYWLVTRLYKSLCAYLIGRL